MFRVTNLDKSYGAHQVLQQVMLAMQSGETLGLIGRNGSGKTTLFRLLLGFLTPDAGQIDWHTADQKRPPLERIGYLPEERGLNLKRTIDDQVMFFGRLKGMTRQQVRSSLDYWFDVFDVVAPKSMKIGALSKGNQQKIQLICSVLHQPEFLILDEPYSGLDPLNISKLNEGIQALKDSGTTIIFSSHNMDNVSAVCDRVCMLHNKRMVLDGTIAEIRHAFPATHVFIEDREEYYQQLQHHDAVQSVSKRSDGSLHVQLTDPEYGRHIFNMVTKTGYTTRFQQEPPTLEEIFNIKAVAEDE